jgi:protocatechuate 3,4-dioxygenase beta subunit
MDNDDRPVGRVLTRREVVALMGMSGAAILAGCRPSRDGASRAAASAAANGDVALPACVVVPEQTEGPYFVDLPLDRADIRSDPGSGAAKAGVPLALAFRVSRVDGSNCIPMAGARVDVWHCDAEGIYSDVEDPSFNTKGQRFLRGYQLTDSSGMARFTTIYPGWYRGRTVHVHFKVRTEPAAARGHEFTSQLYFDDAVSDRIFQRSPYVAGARTRNAQDGIFRRNGEQLLVPVKEAGSGYEAMLDLGMRVA